MTKELADSNLPHDGSPEEIRSLLTEADKVGDLLLPKDNVKVELLSTEKKLAAIKLFKGYKFDKYALKAQTARLREKPVHIEHDRNSGHRRKRP